MRVRKARQKEHPSLTLTQMYNVLEKLKAIEAARQAPLPSPLAGEGADPGRAQRVPGEAGEGVALRQSTPHPARRLRPAPPPSPARGEGDRASGKGSGASGAAVPELTEEEERIKDEGLIVILKELHERLDRLVFEAYGWPATLSDEEFWRLVALHHERAAEERRGHVRWLRPDYQIPRFGKDVDKQAAKEEGAQIGADLGLPEPAGRKPSFPSDAVAQTAAVFAALAQARAPVDADGPCREFPPDQVRRAATFPACSLRWCASAMSRRATARHSISASKRSPDFASIHPGYGRMQR